MADENQGPVDGSEPEEAPEERRVIDVLACWVKPDGRIVWD